MCKIFSRPVFLIRKLRGAPRIPVLLFIIFFSTTINSSASVSGFQGCAYKRNLDGSIGNKLSGADITFTSEDGTFTDTVTTDADGFYRIDLDAARYYVDASLEGYEVYISSPGFFVCKGEGYQTGNIFLESLRVKYVDKNGGAEFTTIQSAVDAAVLGDTIVIGEGEYFENVVLKRGVKLQGAGIGKTVINGRMGMATVWTASDCAVTGITVTGAKYGIVCEGNNAAVYGNLISGSYYGVYIYKSRCIIKGNRISNNTRGVSVFGAGATIEKNEITGNTEAGIYIDSYCPGLNVRHNLIKGGQNGIDAKGGPGNLIGNTVLNITFNCVFFETARYEYNVKNNIFAYSNCGIKGAAKVYDYNLFWNNARNYYELPGGNAANPLFTSYAAGDFTLRPESPCVDEGDPALTDPDGSRSDIGCYPLCADADFLNETVEIEIVLEAQAGNTANTLEADSSTLDALDISTDTAANEDNTDISISTETDNAASSEDSDVFAVNETTVTVKIVSPEETELDEISELILTPEGGIIADIALEFNSSLSGEFQVPESDTVSAADEGETADTGSSVSEPDVTEEEKGNIAADETGAVDNTDEPEESDSAGLQVEEEQNSAASDISFAVFPDGYRVYWDRGTGVVDYTEPVAVIKNNTLQNIVPVVLEEKVVNEFVVAREVTSAHEVSWEPVSVIKIVKAGTGEPIRVKTEEEEIYIPEYAFWGGGAVSADLTQTGMEETFVWDTAFIKIENREPEKPAAAVEEDEPSPVLNPLTPIKVIEVYNESGPVTLSREITITIPYGDYDNDGFVDGTRIPENILLILWYNPDARQWQKISHTLVDAENNVCMTDTDRLGKFAIFSPAYYPPFAVKNLSGKAAGSNAVINWSASPSALRDAYNTYVINGQFYTKEYGVFYNLYWDAGAGEIDYSKPLEKLSRESLSWTSQGLAPGVYRFAVRTEDIEGSEEKNLKYVTVTIACPPGSAEAVIETPAEGKRIRGNAVTVKASVSDETAGVLFQYKSTSSASWENITGIDRKKPFAVYWNVSGLENGPYLLRAIAYDKNNYPDKEPETVEVLVDDVNWDIHEDGNPDVDPNKEHRKCEKVNNKKESKVVIADGTGATIPEGVLKKEKAVLDITVLKPEKIAKYHPPKESSVKPVGVFRKFEFQNGEHLFDKNITLSLPYSDDDNNGIVDNTNVRVEDLAMFYLDEEKEEWIPVSGKDKKNGTKKAAVHSINSREKLVSVRVNHFTIFALMGYAPAEDLDNVIVYPNPFKPQDGHTGVIFDGLTENVKIRIFTVAGRLAKDWEGSTAPDYQWEWDGTNNSGDNVASGLYIYVITADGKEKARGKIAVIR